MKKIEFKYGLTLEEIGMALLFKTKREGNKTVKELAAMGDLTKAKILEYAHKNHITYSYIVKTNS